MENGIKQIEHRFEQHMTSMCKYNPNINIKQKKKKKKEKKKKEKRKKERNKNEIKGSMA